MMRTPIFAVIQLASLLLMHQAGCHALSSAPVGAEELTSLQQWLVQTRRVVSLVQTTPVAPD